MTTLPVSPPARRRTLAVRWAALRGTHPIRVLRWLRTGFLATVAGTAVLCLLVSARADDQRSEARRTQQSIDDIREAGKAARHADDALEEAFDTDQVAMIGTGNDFANDTARVSTYVTSAAEGNAAGARGLTQIQFVQAQVTICVQLANSAVRDAAQDRQTGPEDAAPDRQTGPEEAAHAALTGNREIYMQREVRGTGGLVASLADLRGLQERALDRQRHSFWLDPAVTWALLLGPVVLMLLLTTATGHVLARHFRRRPDGRLGVALLAAVAVPVVLGVLGAYDTANLGESQRAGHPLTLTLALLMLAGAGLLAHVAYRPLLAEYRFQPS